MQCRATNTLCTNTKPDTTCTAVQHVQQKLFVHLASNWVERPLLSLLLSETRMKTIFMKRVLTVLTALCCLFVSFITSCIESAFKHHPGNLQHLMCLSTLCAVVIISQCHIFLMICGCRRLVAIETLLFRQEFENCYAENLL